MNGRCDRLEAAIIARDVDLQRRLARALELSLRQPAEHERIQPLGRAGQKFVPDFRKSCGHRSSVPKCESAAK